MLCCWCISVCEMSVRGRRGRDEDEEKEYDEMRVKKEEMKMMR